MAQHVTAHGSDTFLIEHYRSGERVEELTRAASRVRDAVAQMKQEGKEIEFLSSTIVPRDEYIHSLLAAASEQLVLEALARAEISFERISTAISTQSTTEAEDT